MDIETFDFSVNLLRAILWQYQDATRLQNLLNSKNAWYITNQTEFWQDWIINVFDLRTANAFGLSVWSIILGQSLYTTFQPSIDEPYFGYGSSNQNYGNGNYASLNGGNNVYSPAIARILLQLRYYQLISSGTVPETNRVLKAVFGGMGGAFLVDNHDMTQNYYFNFVIPAELNYMLSNNDILPRPSGVASSFQGL